MLRSNSKEAKNNIRNYIMENFDGDGYEIEAPATFEETATIILNIFRQEYIHDYNRRKGEQHNFYDYCAGLPSIIDTCYFYNRSAVDDLGEILQETDAEKAKYSEQDAERVLTYLIYRELRTGEEKHNRQA